MLSGVFSSSSTGVATDDVDADRRCRRHERQEVFDAVAEFEQLGANLTNLVCSSLTLMQNKLKFVNIV